MTRPCALSIDQQWTQHHASLFGKTLRELILRMQPRLQTEEQFGRLIGVWRHDDQRIRPWSRWNRNQPVARDCVRRLPTVSAHLEVRVNAPWRLRLDRTVLRRRKQRELRLSDDVARHSDHCL